MNAVPTVPPWMRLAAVVWVVGFLFVFFNQELPNNRPATRWEVWSLVPFALMDAVDPPQTEGSLPRGVMYLGQRLPLWGLAAFIVAGAWGWGTVIWQIAFPIVCHWLCQCLRMKRSVPNDEKDTGRTSGTLSGLSDGSPDWTSLEQHYFASLLGLSAVSLIILVLGLAGALSVIVLGSFFAVGLGCGVWLTWGNQNAAAKSTSTGSLWWWLVIAPFLIGIMLGALSPSTDFDVNEYHLGGPKEWYLNGRITFLPHNIYTSFPFLTEMLLLAGMVLAGDWFWGALAGQVVLACFAPLTAIGLYCAGRRGYSEAAGRIAAIVYLSAPWVFRMSIIAYADGGLMTYTGAAALAAWGAWQRFREAATGGDVPPVIDRGQRRDVLLTGLLAGSAMACKYTGLVMAVVPLGLACIAMAFRFSGGRAAWKIATVFSVGVLITIGPWLLKNAVETRNPVYPLGYSVFGGRDLDDVLALKWKRGHARPSAGSVVGEARDLVLKVYDVAAVNDWQSPLVFALAPLVLLTSSTRRRAVFPAVMTGWLFLAWWLFTHHIDRFWVPLIPTAALLAGMGAATAAEMVSRWFIHGVLALGVVFNLGFCATGFVGYNVGLTDLNAARDFTSRIVGPEMAWINAAISHRDLPADTKVLFVGEAEIFPARFPYEYNTVFDRSLFEEWCGEPGDMPSKDRPLRSPAAIQSSFAERDITHIYVNWGEVWRYRQTYGYTDFVHPSRFQVLIHAGVLAPPVNWPNGLGRRPADGLAPSEARLLRQWAPQLFVHGREGEELITGALYPVRP